MILLCDPDILIGTSVSFEISFGKYWQWPDYIKKFCIENGTHNSSSMLWCSNPKTIIRIELMEANFNQFSEMMNAFNNELHEQVGHS